VAISAQGPASIREAAELVRRDYKWVHRNLSELDDRDVVEFEGGGAGQAKTPTCAYDRLESALPFAEPNRGVGATAPWPARWLVECAVVAGNSFTASANLLRADSASREFLIYRELFMISLQLSSCVTEILCAFVHRCVSGSSAVFRQIPGFQIKRIIAYTPVHLRLCGYNIACMPVPGSSKVIPH